MVSTPLQHDRKATVLQRQWSCLGTLLLCFVPHLVTVGGQLNTMLPMNGPLSGGTPFTLSGGSFTTACITKTLTFNSLSTVVTVSASTITGLVPAYVSGVTVPVTVSYGASGSCTSQSFSTTSLFSYDAPVFDGVRYGSKDTLGGGSITITGKNFLPTSVSIALGSTSSNCVSVTSFLSFKCTIPGFSLGARSGLNVTISMNSVQTSLIKFAYDAPVVSSILPQVPKLDGVSTITIFGSNLEATAPAAIKIGPISCQNVQMITPHRVLSCLPGASNELVRTNQVVQVSLFSGLNLVSSWSFEPSNAFLHLVPQGVLKVSLTTHFF
jgi:hypothetical protein